MKKKFRGNTRRYSPRAALAALGLKINSLRLLDPIKQKVVIPQKSIRHTPKLGIIPPNWRELVWDD